MQSSIRFIYRILLFLLLCMSPFLSYSQLADNVKTDSTGAAIPTAIKPMNIIKGVEEANKEIKTTTRKIRLSSSVKKIDSLFPPFAEFIAAQVKRKKHFVDANPNRQKINNLIRKWEGYYDHLSRWESTINEYEERNMIVLEIVTFKVETWELTYKNAVKEKLPLEVLTSVRIVRNDYRRIEKIIIKDNNDFLVLESKINKIKLIVNKVIDELNLLKNS